MSNHERCCTFFDWYEATNCYALSLLLTVRPAGLVQPGRPTRWHNASKDRGSCNPKNKRHYERQSSFYDLRHVKTLSTTQPVFGLTLCFDPFRPRRVGHPN